MQVTSHMKYSGNCFNHTVSDHNILYIMSTRILLMTQSTSIMATKETQILPIVKRLIKMITWL